MIVTKTDRLARSTADLLGVAKRLKVKRAALRIISIQLDTSTPIGKLILMMLSGISEFECDLMLEQQL